jgi:hypothetical protein
MSGQQNPDYFSANQINLIYSTVIGQITGSIAKHISTIQ